MDALGKHVLELVNHALIEVADKTKPVSSSVLQVARIARLRADYENLWWIELEMRSFKDQEAKMRVYREIAPHFSRDELKEISNVATEAYLSERTFSFDPRQEDPAKERMYTLSIAELENLVDTTLQGAQGLPLPASVDPGAAYLHYKAKEDALAAALPYINAYRAILERVRTRVHAYLTNVELQLLTGQTSADAFNSYRHFVETRLATLSPDTLAQLRSAAQREREGADGDEEAFSQALTSCRRALHSFANVIYPSTSERVVGIDGKEHALTDAQYVNRLVQLAVERLAGEREREVVIDRIERLHARLRQLNDLASKGVHGKVDAMAVSLVLTETYLVIGDLIRILDGDTGLDSIEVVSEIEGAAPGGAVS